MSAPGELYITEICSDVFKEQLDKWFGKDRWYLNPSRYADYWDESEFPDIMEINVQNYDTGEIMGVVRIENCFEIEKDMFGKRYIVAIPRKIILVRSEV